MIGARTKLLRSPEHVRLGNELEKHVDSWIRSSRPSELIGLLDDTCLSSLRDVFLEVGGCEGTVWLADRDEFYLVAVHNSGEEADSLVGFEQPVGSGIISMVYAQQQPYCENDIDPSRGHDDTLDRTIAKHTTAMIAVPFYFAYGLRGVISCVQLEEVAVDGGQSGFSSDDVTRLTRVANVVERLVNETLLSAALGLSDAG